MKLSIAAVLASVAIALPAVAQVTPHETNLDQKAAAQETRNARGNQLTDVTADQATKNALERCARLPVEFKTDCEARVHGQGEASGSVIGGGMIKRSVTTVPAAAPANK